MGKCFYKYRPLAVSENSTEIHSFTLNLIQKGELYFSAPSAFNDPFDGVVEYSKTIDITAIKSWLARVPAPLEEKQWVLRKCQENTEKLPKMYAAKRFFKNLLFIYESSKYLNVGLLCRRS